MGKHIVTKAFNTPTRRFSASQEVTERDIDGVLTLAGWVNLGHIEFVADVEAPVDAIAAPAIPDSDPVPDTAPLADEPAPAATNSAEIASAD